MDFAAIRAQADLPGLVMNYTRLRQNGRRTWRGPCPFHLGKHASFAVYQDSGGEWWYKCHSECQAHGSIIDFVMAKHAAECPTELDAAIWLLRSPFCSGLDVRAIETAGDMTWRPREIGERPNADAQPLSWKVIQPYINCLDLPIDPTGKDKTTGRDLWHAQGMDDETIERFRLGCAAHCPMAYDPERPHKKWPALTIPIWEDDIEVLRNVRYRLLEPLSEGGDRYRPHGTGLGLWQYDLRSLWTRPDGSARPTHGRRAIISEGEKKKDVLDGRCKLGWEFGITSATGGCGAWLRSYGDVWQEQYDDCDQVYVVFDPWAEEQAWKTARRFGRRGVAVQLPDKVDDLILSHPRGVDAGLGVFLDELARSKPVVNRRFFEQRAPLYAGVMT